MTTTMHTTPGTPADSVVRGYQFTTDAALAGIRITELPAVASTLTAALAATATIARQVEATGQWITAALRDTADRARAGDLTRLGRHSRRLAHGNAALAVDIARLVTAETNLGHEYTADLVALALRGDADALETMRDLADDGKPVALAVLALVARLANLRAQVAALIAEVAQVITADITPTEKDVAPPRVFLAGSIDADAPPRRSLSACAGCVHPATAYAAAERPPMN